MDVAALILWILTAGGGFYLLGTWIANGGARPGGASKFPPPLIFGHFLLAAVGLVLWIVYVATDAGAVSWVAFALLVVVALLGFTMFARWVPTYRAAPATEPQAVPAGARGVPGEPTSAAEHAVPAERHFPLPIVFGHGLLAATTLVLVLLAALGVGS